MNKAITYTRNGAVIFGVGNGLLNLFKQLNNRDDIPFNWIQLFLATGKGGIIGATGGFVIGSIKDQQMKMKMDSYNGSISRYLSQSLKENECNESSILQMADNVQSKLYKNFRNCLNKQPSLSGSIVKGTSITKSDIDIQLGFKKNVGSLENNYNSVYDFLETNYSSNNIRKQTHSIGMEIEKKGELIRLDIVPVRTCNNKGDDDYIFVRSNSIFIKSTYKKTNLRKQLAALNFTATEKIAIKHLKIWKRENDIVLKSIYLELLVKSAFKNEIILGNLEQRITKVFQYIADNISILRIVDPANTNNILSNTITYDEKKSLSNFCYEMINKISQDKRNIIDYFTIN